MHVNKLATLHLSFTTLWHTHRCRWC